MSDENRIDGRTCYATGTSEQRAWFERQWRIWPERADERFTTNLSFHHGGVLAFREVHGREPAMSRDFRSNVEWLDRSDATPTLNAEIPPPARPLCGSLGDEM